MARKKNVVEPEDDLAGTVEGAARDYFEKERAAYEARTGEKVWYEPATPVTRTPLPEAGETPAVQSDETADEAEGEGSI